MYYIERDIEFVNGIEKISYGFHFISRFQVDYVNTKIEMQISSSINREVWEKNNYSSPMVNFFELDKVPEFSEDPISFMLRTLVTLPSTVFYNSEVKKDYSLNILNRK